MDALVGWEIEVMFSGRGWVVSKAAWASLVWLAARPKVPAVVVRMKRRLDKGLLTFLPANLGELAH